MAALPPPTNPPVGWYPTPDGQRAMYFDGARWHRAAEQHVEPVRPTPLPWWAAAGALVVLVGSLMGARPVLETLEGQPWWMTFTVSLVVGYGPSMIWVWLVLYLDGRSWSEIGWSFRWSDLGWGPLTWLAAVGLQLVIGVLVLSFGIPMAGNVEQLDDGLSRGQVVAMIALVVVIAPIVEEVVFRAVVLRAAAGLMPAAAAIVLQAALFGIAHIDPTRGAGNIGLALVLTGVGAAFGASAWWIRRIGPTIIAHAIFNGVVLSIALSGVADNLPAT